jgi:U3 small nucleolar RNA-associated protein 11
MRNAAPRRPHRERAQPAARAKWGLLEKHKDYSLRAADYNLKKRKLNQLQNKAKDRHPDEFAYGMLSAKTAGQGKHGKGGRENELAHDAVKLLKSQDAGYLRVVLGRGRKEVRRLEEGLGLDAEGGKGRKVVFDEQERALVTEEDEVAGDNPQRVLKDVDVNAIAQEVLDDAEMEGSDDNGEAASRVESPPRMVLSKKTLAKEQDALARLKAERKRRKRLQDMRTAKLELLKKRQKEIMAAADQLDEQRAKMARTIGGTNKNGVKFKVRERKR